ncbi:MAG: hypothetical protein KTR16_08660 [Acidiferrobacterales bacterium]|nr:hypothetical protein [Acidiferrobacterales bacterium]
MNKFVLVNGTQFSKTVQSRNVHNSAEHNWVTVINPTNHRLLLQACDDCGVVKSENSIAKACKAPKGQRLVTGRMVSDTLMVG